MGDSRAPTVAALTRSLTCPLCSTTARVQRAENCSGPAVVARFLVAGVPVVQVVLVPLSEAMDAL